MYRSLLQSYYVWIEIDWSMSIANVLPESFPIFVDWVDRNTSKQGQIYFPFFWWFFLLVVKRVIKKVHFIYPSWRPYFLKISLTLISSLLVNVNILMAAWSKLFSFISWFKITSAIIYIFRLLDEGHANAVDISLFFLLFISSLGTKKIRYMWM